ncbi:hypothetical protein BGZ47_001996 [Haplosporangium gracile]|nr:hypothetical protein BGZ47_001996 [Haplosporangium gracile]
MKTTARSQLLLHETLADKHTLPSLPPPPSKGTTTIAKASLLPVKSDPLQTSPPLSPPLLNNPPLPHLAPPIGQQQQAPLKPGDPMLQVHNTTIHLHPDLNGYLNDLTAKDSDRSGTEPGPGIDRRNVILSSSSTPITPVSPFHQTSKDKEALMHHPLGITADHGPSPDNLDHDDATTTLSNNTPDRIHHHRQHQQQHDSRPATRVAAGLALDHDPLSMANNNYNTNTLLQRSSDSSSNDSIDDLTRTIPKANKPLLQTSRTTAAIDTMESSQPPQSTERTVARSLDPLLQFVDSDRRPQLSSFSRCSPTAPPSASSSSSSARTLAKQSPLEHLSDMGPLEMGRGIDSGVVLNQDPPTHPAINNIRRISTSDSASDPFFRDPSTSTLVSEFSMLSSNSTVATSSGQGQADTDHGTEGSSWSGDHPLLFDYTAEPETIDNNSYHSHGCSSSHPHDYSTASRHKGHTMSLGNPQDPTPLQNSGASGSNARRRRNGPKGAEERSWTSHADKDKDQKQGSGLEPGGKRVIIHQVTTTDTLAGIALNYGIQVSILKKSNKLWTNDSIYTRKYLYIPFEECSVARQPGVVVDETSQSIMLPQRVQPAHERTGSSLPGTPFHGARSSSFTGSSLSEHGPSPSDHSSQASQAHLSPNTAALLGSTPDYGMSPPPISAVAAGMLPSSSGLSRSIPASSASPRLGTWNEPKSMVAPPISSPTMTTTTPKSNNSLQACSLSPRRSTIASSSFAGASRGSDAIVFSEDLPNTVVVSPSMTHEALAARFKEMEYVSSEQHQRKTLVAEQELRTNPIHHRHRTTDLRQYAHLQQHQQKQQQHQQLDSGRNSIASSAAGSRRTSVDLGASEDVMSSVGGLLSRRGSGLGQHEQGSPGSHGDSPAIEEESEDMEGDSCKSTKDEEFVTFGHQQHIYESDDMRPGGGQSRHGSQPSERFETGGPEWTQRRQEVVTVPAGLLSFFPSPEHSKKLETPQSISKLQNRMDSYHTGSLSSSSTTGSGSSPRGTFQDRQGKSARSKGRAALSGDTFQAPTSSSTFTSAPPSSSLTPTPTPTGTGAGPTAPTRLSIAKNAHSNTVRVHHQSYNSQNWSLMGETLVDDLLGAVRSKLQIARRMYDFTTFGFGTLGGGGGAGYSKDSSDPPDLLRRTSLRGSRSRSHRNKEYRNSGSAIELEQAIAGSMATRVVKTTIVHRMPSSSSVASNSLDSSEDHTFPRSVRRKPSAGSNGGGGHGRGASSGSTTSVGGSCSGSTRKRSLRSSNPINHPALMALVNELDKDKKDKEREEQEKKAAAAVVGESDGGLPVVDVLSTTSS